MKIPSDASWCLKKILQCQATALSLFDYCPGQQSQFFFWQDPWLQHKPLVHHFPQGIVSTAESTVMKLAATYMLDREWRLPPHNHIWLMEMRSMVLAIPIAREDSITCFGQKTPGISTIWNNIRERGTPPPWHKVLWHPLHLKKCTFFLWLAFKNRLLTRDRMISFGMNVPYNCVLCNSGMETIQHFFTACPYALRVFHNQQLLLSLDWSAYMQGNIVVGVVSKIKEYLAYLYLAVAGHTIWKERNNRIHNQGHTL